LLSTHQQLKWTQNHLKTRKTSFCGCSRWLIVFHINNSASFTVSSASPSSTLDKHFPTIKQMRSEKMQIKIIFIDSKHFWRIARAFPLVIHVLLFILWCVYALYTLKMMYMRQRGDLNNNKT
jgi:hypothetical protein